MIEEESTESLFLEKSNISEKEQVDLTNSDEILNNNSDKINKTDIFNGKLNNTSNSESEIQSPIILKPSKINDLKSQNKQLAENKDKSNNKLENKINNKRFLIDSDSENDKLCAKQNNETDTNIVNERTENKDESGKDNEKQLKNKINNKSLFMVSSSENEEIDKSSVKRNDDDDDKKTEKDSTENKVVGDNENVKQPGNKINNKRFLIDSDSENEENDKSSAKQNNNEADENILNERTENKDDSDNENVKQFKNKINKRFLLDSDSENEENGYSFVKQNNDKDYKNIEKEDTASNSQTYTKKSRLLQLIDSDSEEETNTTNSENTNYVTTLPLQTNVDIENQTIRRLNSLCDSESSAEESEEIFEPVTTKNIAEKREAKKCEPVKKKMTGKEALEQRQLIQSESQKMIREKRIHLPYHRPKQHTLQEFLNRRSVFSSIIKVPPNTPTGLSLKMSTAELKLADKKFKEREKEIVKFYKSESESEDESQRKNDDIDTSKKLIVDIEKDTENITEVNTIEQENTCEEIVINNEAQKNNTHVAEEKDLEKNLEEAKIVEELKISDQIPEKSCDVVEFDKLLAEKSTENVEMEELGIEDIIKDIDKHKESKLKELREILHKNLPNTKSSETENNDELIQTELNLKQKYSNINIAEDSIEIIKEDENKKKSPESIEEKLKKLNPIYAIDPNFRPRLSGAPNEIIDLDKGLEKYKGINKLKQRFLENIKRSSAKTDNISILNIGNTLLNKENEDPDRPIRKFQVPGAKMKILKMELEEQITKKRLEEWKKRQELIKLENEEEDMYTGEKEDCRLLNDKVLDNEEEDELTDSSSESEEEDDEEEDVEIKEKTTFKSAFFDDEAEVSDPNEFEDSQYNNNEESSDDNEDEEEQEDLEGETSTEPSTKKSLRRIVKAFTEDSDDEIVSRPESSCDKQGSMHNRTSTELFASEIVDDNEDNIPAYQIQSDRLDKTPNKISTQSKNDLTTLLTPTFHLTALQGMNSATKSLQESPNVNVFLPPEPSPLKSHEYVRTILFTDQEPIDEHNLDELEGLCSGKFTATQPENKILKTDTGFSTQENELFSVCSGNFSGFTQREKSSATLSLPTNSTLSEISPNFRLRNENKTTDIDDKKETEQLQSLKLSSKKENTSVNIPKVAKMVIMSSSEDEDKVDDLSVKNKTKLKKKRKRYVIDDISISDEDEFNDERSEDEEITENAAIDRHVDYDSEENEIEYEEIEEMIEKEKPVRKTTDFFDEEAELSGSEWGSDDEDERNLDDYEIEEGDTEKINEKKVQRQLERMHMRNMLDEDQREVKLLQEMLLEDGELHGAGRERKFRWKNADSLSWNTNAEKPNELEEEYEAVESELEWRKMRHERNTFLREHQLKRKAEQNDDDLYNDSQIMKLGQQALRKSLPGSQSQLKTPVTEVISKTDDIKLPFALTIKRGSFLARSESTLAKLAKITKVSDNLIKPKNSKNFLFTSVDKTEEESEINERKRKADGGAPKRFKKLRIVDMSPVPLKKCKNK